MLGRRRIAALRGVMEDSLVVLEAAVHVSTLQARAATSSQLGRGSHEAAELDAKRATLQEAMLTAAL
jgi:hypothetical protein